MARPRRDSNVSQTSTAQEQELGSMYDYLAKIILIGPSGCGKSCLLHRFVKNEWRILTSQTIGVEFASKILRLGQPPHHTRIKLQLWDTAGTERFRSVSRSYYRGAAGAILVYDVTSRASLAALPTFLHDARALAGDGLVVHMAGNKLDATDSTAAAADANASSLSPQDPTSTTLPPTSSHPELPSSSSAAEPTAGTRQTRTVAAQGRAVSGQEAANWATAQRIATAVEVSALDGRGVDELFSRLAATILARIELGDIDPADPASGIQYGDRSFARGDDGGASSIRSGRSGWSVVSDGLRRRGAGGRANRPGAMTAAVKLEGWHGADRCAARWQEEDDGVLLEGRGEYERA